jgi:hypothetical protein
MKKNYFDLLDQLRAIAQLGINYSRDPYDLERYRRLMELTSSEFRGLCLTLKAGYCLSSE